MRAAPQKRAEPEREDREKNKEKDIPARERGSHSSVQAKVRRPDLAQLEKTGFFLVLLLTFLLLLLLVFFFSLPPPFYFILFFASRSFRFSFAVALTETTRFLLARTAATRDGSLFRGCRRSGGERFLFRVKREPLRIKRTKIPRIFLSLLPSRWDSHRRPHLFPSFSSSRVLPPPLPPRSAPCR